MNGAPRAERVESRAKAAQMSVRPITARDAYLRAHNYYRTAQFFLLGSDPRKKDAYLPLTWRAAPYPACEQ